MILTGRVALEAYPAYRAAVAAFAELTALTNDPEDIAALSAVEKQSGYKPAREADGSLIRFSDARWNYENYKTTEDDGKGDYPRIDRPIVYLRRAYALAYSHYQAAPSAETKKDLANICLMLHRTAHISERDKELTRDGITLEVCEKDMELLNEDAEADGTLAAWVSFSAVLDSTAAYAVSVGISNEPENEEIAKRLMKKACTVHENIRDRWPSLEQRRTYAAFRSSFVIKLRGSPAEAERKHLAKEALGAWKDIYTETRLAADREARKKAIHAFNAEYSSGEESL